MEVCHKYFDDWLQKLHYYLVVEDLIQPQKKIWFLKWKEKVELGNLKCRHFFYERNIQRRLNKTIVLFEMRKVISQNTNNKVY